MIRKISQKKQKISIVKKNIKKNTTKEIEQIQKLILLLQHLDTDLCFLKEDNLILKDDVNTNCQNKSTDKLIAKGLKENQTCNTQKQSHPLKDTSTLEQETHFLCKDFLDQYKRNKKKNRV
ncbi:unnamed protein product [Paramecium pentaurelia]|uniref:Uncharacterized protein n=1 Tax=Paramecium pentaurelia TaxID=43138 RepID=A0A8S1WQJ9_9CILI|nr:unnamed protein product [Paramecium pentaurelia]